MLLLASGFAIYVATWIAINVVSPFPLEFRENAVLFTQLGQGLSIVARPDSLGLFLFLASLVVPYRFRFSPSALLFSALLSILGFLTKPYFILGLGLVWLHLFVFESKSKAILFGLG